MKFVEIFCFVKWQIIGSRFRSLEKVSTVEAMTNDMMRYANDDEWQNLNRIACACRINKF